VKRVLSITMCLVLIVGVTCFFAACGSEETTTTGGVTTTSQGSSSTEPTEIKTGGTLTLVMPAVTPVIGWPAGMGNSGSGSMVQLCLETLLHQDEDGAIVPWLAESYEVAADHTSIVFTIRKNVKFHDGSDLNAEVVKWNLDQFKDANPTWSSIEVVDAYTVKVNLSSWSNTVVMGFADAATLISMVSKVAYDTNGLDWMKANPVGTGAFKFVEYKAGQTAKFVKNEAYWGKDDQGNQLPYLDGVNYIFSDDETTREQLMLTGQGDWALSVGPGNSAAKMRDAGLNIIIPSDMTVNLFPDTADASSPWSKAEVREAAEYAIDKEEIASGLGLGFVEPVTQLIPRASASYDSSYQPTRSYDPEKAKQLLASAGYPNGFDTTLILSPVGADKDLAAAIQGYLAKVGIKAKLDTPDQGRFFSYVGTGRWPSNGILMMGIPTVDSSFEGGFSFMFSMVGASWEKKAEVTTAYNQLLTQDTPDAEAIRSIAETLMSDASVIPVMETGAGVALQTYVHGTGLLERGSSTTFNLETTWIDK
jgi:peptide/nickel transport system substrate-binding protein